MSLWHRLLFDVLCPSLLYSVVYSTFLAILISIILKGLKIENPKWRSYLYLQPLLVPLVVFASFPPSITLILIQLSVDDPTKEVVATEVYSIAGLLCLMGLITGIVLFILLYMFGSKLVYWLQGVVELTPEENLPLIAMTKRLAKRASITMPRIGLTEDLRPNAFTTGHGKKATIVVTVGLLNTLVEPELEAVIAHEVAHIKNKDFHFYVLTMVLQVVSFFNPLAFFLAAAIRREREMLADRTGSTFLNQPESMGLALTKLWEASKEWSWKHFRRWVSGIFILSEMRHTHKVLSKHPALDTRLNQLTKGGLWNPPRKREVLRMVAACFLILTMVVGICAPFIKMREWFSWIEPQGVHAIGLQMVTKDASTITFMVDNNYFRIANYFRIYDNLQIYNIYRIIYLPDYGLTAPSSIRDFSMICKSNYYLIHRLTTILPWIVTFITLAMIACMLLRVCSNDMGSGKKVQHSLSPI